MAEASPHRGRLSIRDRIQLVSRAAASTRPARPAEIPIISRTLRLTSSSTKLTPTTRQLLSSTLVTA